MQFKFLKKLLFILILFISFLYSSLNPVKAATIGSGDVNGDGKINFSDIQLLLQNIFGIADSSFDQFKDSRVNIFDGAVIFDKLMLPTSTPSATIAPTISGQTVVLAAAGDSVCGTADIGSGFPCKDKETAQVISSINPLYFLALGDLQYESGSYSDFMTYYNNPLSWSMHKAITRPVVGNHEYGTSGASGYFQYFGGLAGPSGKGYYSFEAGEWHVVALNSNCNISGFDNAKGCDSGSAQDIWLKADLLAHPNKCTLAIMHHPFFTSGQADMPKLAPLIQDLYDAKVDLMLTGHKHMYEQFAPQSITSAADPNGIREIVVGTGGRDLTGVGSITFPNLEVRNGNTFGVLKLTLAPTSYTWQFKPIAGQTFTVSGSGTCH